MTISTVMDVLTGMLVLGAKVSTPIMGIGIAIGLIIAIFMAATQSPRAESPVCSKDYCDWDDPPRGWPLDARYLRNLHHRYL